MNETPNPYEGETDGNAITPERVVTGIDDEEWWASYYEARRQYKERERLVVAEAAKRAETFNRAWAEAFQLMEKAGLPTNHVPNRADRRQMAKQMKTKEFKPGNKNG